MTTEGRRGEKERGAGRGRSRTNEGRKAGKEKDETGGRGSERCVGVGGAAEKALAYSSLAVSRYELVRSRQTPPDECRDARNDGEDMVGSATSCAMLFSSSSTGTKSFHSSFSSWRGKRLFSNHGASALRAPVAILLPLSFLSLPCPRQSFSLFPSFFSFSIDRLAFALL